MKCPKCNKDGNIEFYGTPDHEGTVGAIRHNTEERCFLNLEKFLMVPGGKEIVASENPSLLRTGDDK